MTNTLLYLTTEKILQIGLSLCRAYMFYQTGFYI